MRRRIAYARKLGVTTRELRKMGGIRRAKALTPEARALLMPRKRT